MTERILGPEGGKRRRGFWLIPTIAVVAAVVFYVAGAGAVPGGGSVFELDASLDQSNGSAPRAAVTDNGTSGLPDDWDRVCHTGTSGAQCASAADDHAIARSFDTETAADGTANSQTIFTTGGSKDQQALSQWQYKDQLGGLPDKDNLLHAMAARYQSGANSYIFFGADRFDNSGDAQIGFWFFKSAVCTKADGTFGTGQQSSCSGTATHVAGSVPHNPANPGDILILSDFTNGGTQPTIRVFEYVGSGGSDGSLNLLGGTDTDVRDCGLVSTDDFCAAVNNLDGAVAPWLFKNKSGASTFGHGEFYEGGLNLNTLGLQNECFSSFLAETRSSQSVTATLKDFVLGGFQQCGASLTTSPSSTSFVIGGSVTDSATVHVSGGASPPAPTGSVSFYLCGPSAGITSCDSSGTSKGSVNLSTAVKSGNDYTVTSASITPTSAGDYCFFATWPGDTNYAGGPFSDGDSSECFTVTPKTPTISTQVSNAGPVTPGTAISDTATLGNTAAPSNGTNGTITFRAYGPDDATCATAVYTSVANVTGNGSYNSFTNGNGGAFAPTSPGTYRWRAFYAPASGDVNNVAVSTACNDANESFVVQQFNPTLTTAQTVTIKDSVTISAGGGGNLAGTAHVQPFSNSTCTAGNELAAQQNLPVSGASPQTVSTTAITITDPGQPTIYWKVSYDSTNPAQTGIAASCTENASLVIND